MWFLECGKNSKGKNVVDQNVDGNLNDLYNVVLRWKFQKDHENVKDGDDEILKDDDDEMKDRVGKIDENECDKIQI